MTLPDPNLDERGHVRRGTTWADVEGRRTVVGPVFRSAEERQRVMRPDHGHVATLHPSQVRALYDERHKPTHEAESLQTQRRRRRRGR